MNSRLWLNIGLLGLVLVLGVAVWYESSQTPHASSPPLTQLKPEAVNKIEIFRRDHDHLILTGHGDQWWMRAPVRIAADRYQVENVLRVLGADSLAQFPAEGKNLAAYEHTKPKKQQRNNNTELAFGGMTPVELRRF